jgi:hypothetical protein
VRANALATPSGVAERRECPPGLPRECPPGLPRECPPGLPRECPPGLLNAANASGVAAGANAHRGCRAPPPGCDRDPPGPPGLRNAFRGCETPGDSPPGLGCTLRAAVPNSLRGCGCGPPNSLRGYDRCMGWCSRRGEPVRSHLSKEAGSPASTRRWACRISASYRVSILAGNAAYVEDATSESGRGSPRTVRIP